MKKNINEKIRLVLILTICVLLITIVFSNAVGKPQVNDNVELLDTEPVPYRDPMSTGIFNFRILNRDWNYWSNKPHLFSMVTGNVGIGQTPPDDAKLYVKTDPADWKYAIYAIGQKGIKGISTALDGTGIIGEGGHAGVKGIGSYIGIIGQGYYGGWFEGTSFFSDKVGIRTNNPTSELEVNGTIKANTFIGDGSNLTGISMGFEEWNDSVEFNTIYQAETDGFVSAWIRVPDDHNNYYYLLEAYTDENNPPTTMRACDEIMHTGTPSELYGSILMPVKNGDYWEVKNYPLYGGSPCNGEIYWLPFGT